MKDPGPDSKLCLLLIDTVIASVVDPIRVFFGPPDSGSVIQRYGSGSVSQRYGSGCFDHRAKIVRNPQFVLFFGFVMTFLS
jgi:hypothetical protein